MHLFIILQFYTILCILICFEAPRIILDMALYQIKYIIIIIITIIIIIIIVILSLKLNMLLNYFKITKLKHLISDDVLLKPL